MANVQVAKCMHYTGIPTTLIPDNNPCSNPDGVGSQRFNISYLPANTPKSPFVAYMPLQMANAIRAGQNTQASSIKIPAIPRPHVTPKAQNTGVQPLSSFPPYSNPIAFPQPFHGSGEYSAPSSRPSFYDAYEPRRHQRSHSKRRASKRRSKSPRKDKSREKVHSTNNSNKKKDSSPPAPPAVSAHPQPPILPPQPPQHPRANPPAPFVPTPEQLLSAPLRPVQPKQRPYSLIGVQTIPLNGEIEKKKPERKRNVSLDESRWPFEHVPMVPYLPLCPHMCSQQTRSMRSEKRLQRLLDMCEGVVEPSKRPVVPTLPAADVAPLKTLIRPSPPPQQPSQFQGLFGLRKGVPASKTTLEEELPSWVQRNDNNDEGRPWRKEAARRTTSVPPPAPPPPPPPPPSTYFGSPAQVPEKPPVEAPQPTPKVGPKPVIQWPPRILTEEKPQPEKTMTPPLIEYGGNQDSGSSVLSQMEGTYEVILDYSNENSLESDGGESERNQPWGNRIYGSGVTQRSQANRGPYHPEIRGGHPRGPSSGTYQNLEGNFQPKVGLGDVCSSPLCVTPVSRSPLFHA
ncbi:unnamed protein product [Mesocestoides corti]|uniref:Uncharacterized protein n=1 Tax=Mesocestoides corti TaxID=53468 RepID=A0A158QVU7_MESCO|nr:unnamed protein product [Mesocestoides corti]